ncbi:hypothetical protein BDV93DRAFT_401423, partial [Ceratobasidium sp. AG-I]
AKGTLANYQSAVHMFTKFCDIHGIHQYLWLPADEFVLCTFAASLAGDFSCSYANSIFAGLKTWHTIHNANWKGGPRLQLVLCGVTRLAPTSSWKEPHRLITPQTLDKLHAGLDLNSAFNTSVLATA